MSSRDFPSMLEDAPEPIFIPLYSSGASMAKCGCTGSSTPNGIHVYPCITHSGVNALPLPQYLHFAVMYDADAELDKKINEDLEKLPGSRVHSVTQISEPWGGGGYHVNRVLVIYDALSIPEEAEEGKNG